MPSHRTLVAVTATAVGLTTSGFAAAAEVDTVVIRTPINEVASLICVDEPVLITGDIRTTFHTTDSAAGGYVQTSSYTNLQGVGLESGQLYRVVGTPYGNVTYHSGDPLRTVETRVTTASIIATGGLGSGPAFRIRVLERYTMNANGDLTSQLGEYYEECF